MITNELFGMQVSRLGFGAMRLPQTPENRVDEKALGEMIDYAMEHGVNYYDTAYVYHAGFSEKALGRALKKYDRGSYFLADKFPGHVIADSFDPPKTFQEQLDRCGTDYFDFYLLHNVYENSVGVYEDPRWDILGYLKEEKKRGRIRHLGMSTHARPDTLEKFLDYAGDSLEFCQIQLNYLDWSLQEGDRKVQLLAERGLPLIIMEPLRGGRLANLPEEASARLAALRPEESTASWAFRYLCRIPNVKVILSGMSDLAQVQDNVKTFSSGAPQTEEEALLLEKIAEELKDALPCTRCRYCCDGCPRGLDIPTMIHAYNDMKYSGGNMIVRMQFDAVPEDKKPSACIGCGACAAVCPQKIDIPRALKELVVLMDGTVSWADVCRQREEEAKRLKAEG